MFLTIDDSNVVVSVPTIVVLDGNATADGRYVGEYSVQVSGNIAGNESLVVQPNVDTVTLSQQGKLDKDAIVSQTKTVFSSDDLKNDSVTEGSISATGLTAGSWNGTGTFVISMTSKMQYYSTVELAVADANTLSYDNADCKTAEDENAVAALYLNEDENQATIRLLKDVDNVEDFALLNNTTLDLDNHSLTFSTDTSGELSSRILYKKDFCVFDGTINNVNKSLIADSSNNEGETFKANSVIFNTEMTPENSSHSYVVDVSDNSTVSNCQFNTYGQGNLQYAVITLNCDENESLEISNVSFNNTIDTSYRYRNVQTYGNALIENSSFSSVSHNSNPSAIWISSASHTIIDNCEIDLKDSESSYTYTIGIQSYGTSTVDVSNTNIKAEDAGIAAYRNSNMNVTDVNVYCESFDELRGMGIMSYDSANLTITETEPGKVNVYGKQWGLETSPLGKAEINGGTYSSTNHIAYIEGDGNFHNVKFITQDRDKYDVVDVGFGLYLGGPSTPNDAVVNFYNCQFGSEVKSERDYFYTLTAKNNDGYTPISETNLYDCTLYQGNYYVFSFNDAIESHITDAKFNLYGNTVIYDKNCNLISKETLANSIDTWKTKTKYDASKQLYDERFIGDSYIMGWIADVDKDTGEIRAIYATDDTNVYDYRN